MVKKEKYVNWLSVAIPETYVFQIRDFLKAIKVCPSVAEYVRRAVEIQLKEDLNKLSPKDK